jgi:putative ATP-dependent endonuclease of OLD family
MSAVSLDQGEDAHPLAGFGLKLQKFKCFGDVPGSIPLFTPVSIIIGRNNSGKSAVIDALDICCSKGASLDEARHSRSGAESKFTFVTSVDEASIARVFRKDTSGGSIPGNHFDYGKRFIGQQMGVTYGKGWSGVVTQGLDFSGLGVSEASKINRSLGSVAKYPLEGTRLVRVLADRDVQPEAANPLKDLQSNGVGVTNLVRAFINSADLPREKVENELLENLNMIYEPDGYFRRIVVQEDESTRWEIYLDEEKKGLIRLSQSGSSLKTVFLTLSFLVLEAYRSDFIWSKLIFSLEEPENNLHPSLLRRFLNFMADQRAERGFSLLLTTHSPICIDWAAKRNDSQVLHVNHTDG